MDKTVELVNSVKDIHAMPSVIVKALNIMKKPTASMKELGDIVMFDQSILSYFWHSCLNFLINSYNSFVNFIYSFSSKLNL